METGKVVPVIYVSRCLGFDKCRWNGDMINDSFVNLLKEFVEFHHVCPESDIGLGIPRNPVRLVRGEKEKEHRMKQPATGYDCTEEMMNYSIKTVEDIKTVDGFLLKNASPSCGINNIKIYASTEKGSSVAKSTGMFTSVVQKYYPSIPIEDEGRLHNFVIRENWLIAVYTLARFRRLFDKSKISDLYNFHARCKYLFMSYSQAKLKSLGHLIANHNKVSFNELYASYHEGLLELIHLKPTTKKRINVLMHIMGYFSEKLVSSEKQYFLNLLEEYRRGAMPLTVPLEIIKSWALRFENEYILNQYILQPYPKELLLLSDSGKGRDLKR